jgi:hypothetical protein
VQPTKDNKLIFEAEPTIEGIVLGMGGCDTIKDSSWLDVNLVCQLRRH